MTSIHHRHLLPIRPSPTTTINQTALDQQSRGSGNLGRRDTISSKRINQYYDTQYAGHLAEPREWAWISMGHAPVHLLHPKCQPILLKTVFCFFFPHKYTHIINLIFFSLFLLTFPNYLRKTKVSTPVCSLSHFSICSKDSLNSDKSKRTQIIHLYQEN